MRILLVDDDERVLATLKRMVDQLGYEADCAHNAMDAALLVRTRHYDFILLDFRMPGKTGRWFMENASLPPDTKVLLMSGFAPQAEVERLMRMGATAYVAKPFGVDELTRLLAGEQLPVKRLAARMDHILDVQGDGQSGRTLVCLKEIASTT